MSWRAALSAALVLACSLVRCGSASPPVDAAAANGESATMVTAPAFEVDPYWPKPLPNHWVLGSTIGVAVDARDHVWVIHRPQTVEDNFKAAAFTPPIGTCCTPAPPIVEFDAEGNYVSHRGGPGEGYEWPVANHGLTIDHRGNFWVGGNDDRDSHVLKFAPDGSFLLQIGKLGVHNGSNDTQHLWRAAKVFVDPATDEAYIADGYGNRRVIVFDANTGAYKRHWGAYGAAPADAKLADYDPAAPPEKHFRTVHCAIVSTDGFVYVCDRANDRIQVFRRDGAFVRESFFEPKTLRSGSVWDLAFSRDDAQTYLFMVDGINQKVRVLDRKTLNVLTSFGDGGRQPGQFYGVHNIAVDSKGNLFTTETYSGARVQRFAFRGVRQLPREQGVPWAQ
jgi:hypothetical protein